MYTFNRTLSHCNSKILGILNFILAVLMQRNLITLYESLYNRKLRFKTTAKTVYNQSCSQRWIRKDHDQSKLIESINFVKKTTTRTDQTMWKGCSYDTPDWPIPVFIRFIREITKLQKYICSSTMGGSDVVWCFYLCNVVCCRSSLVPVEDVWVARIVLKGKHG